VCGNYKGTKTKKTQKQKAETIRKVQQDEEDAPCQELYSESVDGFICCRVSRVCYKWAHELCAGKENDSTDFVCELCLE